MKNIKNTLLSLILISASFTFADSGARRAECEGEASCNQSTPVADGFLAAGDLVLVRPVSTAATIGAFGIFVVIAPFTEMAGCTEETYAGLVESVGKFSFDRDLGDFKK